MMPNIFIITRDTPKIKPPIYFYGNYNRYKKHNNLAGRSLNFFIKKNTRIDIYQRFMNVYVNQTVHMNTVKQCVIRFSSG